MHVDYSLYNHCNVCKLKYPKDKYFCDECGRRIRTSSKVVKSHVREKMKQLASKRY
jgi:rRNA maturation endonuclease Nob1